MNLGLFEIGFTPEMLGNTVCKSQGLIQIAIRKFFKLHISEPWMAPLLARIRQEESMERQHDHDVRLIPSISREEQGIMSIFPPVGKTCNPGFKNREKYCLTGVKFLWDLGKVVDKELNPDTFSEILDLYSNIENASEMYEESIDPRYDVLENPGVQVNIIYSAMIPTKLKLYYNKDPKTKTNNGQIYTPDETEMAMGDQGVLAASALGPGIKWADEFMRGKEGAKPVNLIEICSEFRRRESVFNLKSEKKVDMNAYFGIKCNCRNAFNIIKTTGIECNHPGLMTDPYLMEFVVQSLKTEEEGEVGQKFQEMSPEELEDYVDNCRLFRQI